MDNDLLIPVEFEIEDEATIAFDVGEDELIDVELGDAVIIGRAEQIYDGETDITPMINTVQTLETKDKLVQQNITIRQIPVTQTTNIFGGKTVVIG